MKNMVTKMISFQILILLCASLSYVSSKRVCGNVFVTERVEQSPGEFTTRQAYVAEYSCPHKVHSTLTHCCTPPLHECCREPYFYEIELSIAVIIIIGSVLTSSVLIFTILVCCFCERCPMYGVCVRNAKGDWIATKDEAAALVTRDANGVAVVTMPTESETGARSYDVQRDDQAILLQQSKKEMRGQPKLAVYRPTEV